MSNLFGQLTNEINAVNDELIRVSMLLEKLVGKERLEDGKEKQLGELLQLPRHQLSQLPLLPVLRHPRRGPIISIDLSRQAMRFLD